MLDDGDGNQTLEKQSSRWYNKRPVCAELGREARKTLPEIVDEESSYRLIIVRRRVVYRSVDEIDERSARCAAERMLTLCFAMKINELIKKRATETCPACEIEDPSQLHHDCLMLDFEDHINMHFGYAYNTVSDHAVLSRWETFLRNTGILRKIHPIYLLKYRCVEWLNNDFKSIEWKRSVKQMCKDLHKFKTE